MKLFAVHNNRASSDMEVLSEEAVGGYHSAGVVILADSVGDALSILRQRLGEDFDYFMGSVPRSQDTVEAGIQLSEVKSQERGIVLFCDGEC